MKLEPFRMSLNQYSETEDGLYIDGEIEQGILYEGDSLRIGRLIFATRFLETDSGDKYKTIITFLRSTSNRYNLSEKTYVQHNNDVQIYLPTAKLEHIVQVKNAYFVDRQYFVMPIEDIFTVKGRGTCITGNTRYGRLRREDRIRLTNDIDNDIETTVKDFIIFGYADEIQTGDNISLLLEDVSLDDVKGRLIATTQGVIK